MEEACAMSDKVGVMLDGRILDYGAPERIFSAPANLETARFLGPVNTVPKRCFPSLGIAEEAEEIYVLPNAVELTPAGSLDPNAGRARGTVRDVRFTGKTYETTVDTEGYRLTVRSVAKPPQQGSEVHLNIRTYLVHSRVHGPSRKNGERVGDIFGLSDRSLSNGGREMLVPKSPPAAVPHRADTKATAKEEVFL
jgi:ABC-type Fe3+/spermidine/putrescine transport system ATPase subunit